MNCRVSTPKEIEFRSKLGFNQYHITLTKEQPVSKSVIDAFEGETMQTQYRVLGYQIDFYFHDHKLAIDVDEKGYKDRNIDYEIQRKKVLQKELGCKFIRIGPDEESFDIFNTINQIHRHIKKSTKESTKESTKKYLIDQFSNKLLRLGSKSNNSIKTKYLKYAVKKILPTL